MKINSKKIYSCDPDKNDKCAKDNCYRGKYGRYCRCTDKKEYRMINPFKRLYEWFKYNK